MHWMEHGARLVHEPRSPHLQPALLQNLRAYRPALSFPVPCSLPQCQAKPAGTLETSPEFSLTLYPDASIRAKSQWGFLPAP